MSAPAPAPCLEMRGIEKDFGGVQALKGADVSARAGEILGLCGENGAGKSTLLKVLSGVHPHGSYRGELLLDGAPRRFRGTREAQRAGIAIVHQELMLVPELSVADNLLLGREPMGPLGLIDEVAAEGLARRLLLRYGFGQEIDPGAAVGGLGIGLRQIVEIVRALAQDARILVLDEPTAALTSSETDRLMALLRELKQAGAACVYVSHRLDEVFALCQRVTVLRDGRTVGTVETSSSSQRDVVAMMVGREVSAPPRAPRARGDGPPVLEVLDLSLDRPGGGRPALDRVSLCLGRGEIVALCGAMGAGRTALLTSLFGAARGPLRGQVRLGGAPLRLATPRDAIDAGLALLPEDRKGQGLVLHMTVAENLSLPLLESGGALLDPVADELLARRRIRELSIRGAVDLPVVALSGGNQQKVALGKWLERPPKVLLLDEPTRGVDVGAREEIYGLVEALCARGVAVLMASSDLQEVLRLAHRVLVLRGGRLVGELPADGAREADILHLSLGTESAGSEARP